MTTNVENGSNSQGSSPSLATILHDMTWGGGSYPPYEGQCNTAVVDAGAAPAADNGSAAAGGGGGTPAPGAGSPPAGQNGADSSAAGQGGNGAQGAPSNDENIRTLRQNYETLRPWEKAAQTIKDPARAVASFERLNKMNTDGLAMAKQLGYTEESYQAAFNDDPVDTLSHLRAEFAKANPQHAETERIRKMAEQAAKDATKPITDQMNRQQTESAMTRYDSEFNRLVSDPKTGFGPDVSDDVKNALNDIMDQIIPDSVLMEIKQHGKISGVQAAYDQAKGILLKVVNAYNAMVAKQSQGGGGQGGGGSRNLRPAGQGGGGNGAGADKPMTLDDIINNPEAHLPGLKAGKY